MTSVDDTDRSVFDNPLDSRVLAAWKDEVHAVNEANGWFEEGRDFEEGIALIHSEIAEMLEAYRDHGLEDATQPYRFHVDRDQPMPLVKPEGVAAEAADVLIRLLDEAYRQDVDVVACGTFAHAAGLPFGTAIARLHLTVANWHDFVRPYLDSPEDAVTKRRMTMGLSRAYNYLLAICDEFDIDLVSEYRRKIGYNATRGHRHGGKRL